MLLGAPTWAPKNIYNFNNLCTHSTADELSRSLVVNRDKNLWPY